MPRGGSLDHLSLVASPGLFLQGERSGGVEEIRRPNSREHYGKRARTGFPGGNRSLNRTPRVLDHQRGSREVPLGVYPRLARGGSDRRACASDSSVLLFKNVHGPQGWRGEEKAYYRPVSFEQENKEERVSNGRFEEGSKNSRSKPLGSEIGSKGRVLPCPHLPRVLEVLCVCPRRKGLLLQSSSLRTNFSPLGILEGSKADKEVITASGYSGDGVLGRLLDPGPVLPGVSGPYCEGHRPSAEAGFQDQLGEVFKSSSKASRVSGRDSRPGNLDLLPSRGQGPNDLALLQKWPEGFSAFKEGFREASRLFQFRSPVFEVGKAVSKAHPGLDEPPHFSISERWLGSNGRLPEGSSDSLGGSRFPALPSANEASSIFKSFDDRCLRLRLGGNSSSRDPSWGLASGMEQSVDKLERIEGYSFIADGFSVKTGGALRKDPFRQQVSLGLYQERRLPCLQSSLGALEGSTALCPVKGDNSLSSSPKGLSERSGRQSFQEHFDKYRMESGQALLREPLQEVGSPSNRSVCYSREQPAPSLRFSLPRSQGSCLRRLQFGLGPLELNFPLSSLSGFGRGNSEAGGLQGRGLFNSSFLANGSLVRLLRQEVSGQDSPPRRGLLVPDMFRNNVLPQAPFYFQPSRLGSIEQAIRKEGLNDFSVRVLLRCHKKSTIRQYQSVWSKFLAFLSREGILHHKVNVKDVLNFLSFFAEFHNFAYKTLAVYKCALRLPLLFCLGLNLDCELVTYFMRGLFDLNPPPTHGFMPSWDLSDLLLYLRSDEFFPLESISWYRLTQKTLALLLLASGRRISEIAALSRDFYKRGSRIFLKWVRGFRAKNHTVDHSPEDPSILEMSRVDDLDLRNCPVRAWKVFLDRRSLVTNVRDDACLWTLEVKALFTAFKALIRDSRRFVGKPDNIVMVPQQTKKLATSYCIKYFSNANKALHKRTGNKVFGTLNRLYIRDVPRLRIPVSLPLGTVPPRVR